MAGGLDPSGFSSADVFIISRLGDTTSYFFTWFCKKYRIRTGARDLDGDSKEETQSRCPICLDACTKSIIELRCGHSFCRACLTRSAANNMTSCALCRREQEINPELLRARFDEQRMLNLAQRLAIPPPVSSRRFSPAASTTAGEGGRQEKAGVKSRGSTSSREMLFGPWGDVGAMSADDLRRRWKFSSAQTSTAPGAETVGAASASEIGFAWCQLLQAMCMQSKREVIDTPLLVSPSAQSRANGLSCCGNAHDSARESGVDTRGSPNVSPHSPCAGASSPTELSIRWRSMPKIPPVMVTAEEGSTDEKFSDVGSLSATYLQERWHEANGLEGIGHVAVSELSDKMDLATGSQGVGSLSAICLQKRWHEANGVEGVGGLAVSELSETRDLAMGSQGIGGMSGSCLWKRWHEVNGAEGVGGLTVSELSETRDLAMGSQGSGGLSATCLRERWHEANGLEGIGHLAVSELSTRLDQAIGSHDIGGLSATCLRERWHEASGVEGVGGLAVSELSERGDLGTAGAILEKRSSANMQQKHVDGDNWSWKQAVGPVNTSALRTRLCVIARTSAPVG